MRAPIYRWSTGLGVLLFVLLAAASIALYPGGTHFEPNRVGHDFLRNFLCDLIASHTPGGRATGISAVLMKSAMACFVLGASSFFLLSRKMLRRSQWLCVVGALTAPLLFGVPLVPADTHPVAHGLIIVFGGLPPLLAAAALGLLLALEHGQPWILRALSLMTVACCATAFGAYAWHLAHRTPCTVFLPASQKAAVLSVIAWIGAVLAVERTPAR